MSEAVPLSVFKNCQQQRDRLWTENGGTPGKGFALFQTLPWPSPPGSEVAYFCRLQSQGGAEPVAPPLGACFHVTGTTSAARGTVVVDRWSRLTDWLSDQLTCHLPTRSQQRCYRLTSIPVREPTTARKWFPTSMASIETRCRPHLQ